MADKLVSKKDIIKGWAKYYLCAEVSSGFERLTAPAFSFGMDPVLNKLYHDNPEEYKEALKRHLMFYNCEATWGSMLFGMSCALEEERAVRLKEGASKEELDASSELISNLKIGLMGPLASAGAWIAGVAPLLIWGVCISLFAYFLMSKGYSLGQKSVVNILQSSALTRLINMASVLGLFMMGALSSTYVKLKSVVSWTDVAGKAVYLQDKLDAIFPNVLPLLVVFGVYFYIKKEGPKYVRILVFLIVAALLLSFLGIV